MKLLRRLLLGALGCYVLVCGLLFVFQRRLVFPGAEAVPYPAGWEIRETAAGLPVAVFPGSPMVVFFHGNGTAMASMGHVVASLQGGGVGVLLVEYPGYAGAPGSPSEPALIAAANAAIDVLEQLPVCVGHSLGTGVAVAMAAEGRCSRLVLLAPYTALTAMAARRYPFVPTGLLLLDRFDSLARAASIKVPVLVIHGADDDNVPPSMGETLAGAIGGAQFEVEAGRGHMEVLDPEPLGRVAAFARGER